MLCGGDEAVIQLAETGNGIEQPSRWCFGRELQKMAERAMHDYRLKYIKLRRMSYLPIQKRRSDINEEDPFVYGWVKEEYSLMKKYFQDFSMSCYRDYAKAALADVLLEDGMRETVLQVLERAKEILIRSEIYYLENGNILLDYKKNEPLTKDNLNLFEEKVRDKEFIEESRVCNNVHTKTYLELYLQHLRKRDKRIQLICNGLRPREIQEVFEECMKKMRINPEGYLQEEIDKYFSLECIYKHLKRNQKRNLAEHIAAREEFYKNGGRRLLERIPDCYADLYPNAREKKRKFFIHYGPTNSGKTHDALTCLKAARHGLYAGPLRLLAYEIYDRLNRDGVYCSMRTGEERIDVPGYNVMSSTVEMVDLDEEYDIAVIDEAQMLANPLRGGAWTRAILGLQAEEIHLCCSADAVSILCKLITECKDSYEMIRHERNTPLYFDDREFRFPESVEPYDALIVFSRKMVYMVADVLREKGWNVSMIYGDLPYDVRHREAARFISKESQVLVSTDAIGMGLNLPIRRVVFLKTTKFDGRYTRQLFSHEIQQIGGRAGRFGLYDEGYVCAEDDTEYIKKRLNMPTPDIQYAVIRFPETILDIDASLMEILQRWKAVTVNAGYRKADIDREIRLCSMLTPEIRDKMFMYRAVSIPFDDKEKDLLDLWQVLVSAEYQGKSVFREKLEQYGEHIGGGLEELEKKYRIFDLLYNYSHKFGYSEESGRIMQIKTSLADKITYRLAQLDKKRHIINPNIPK